MQGEMRHGILVMNGKMVVEMSSELSDTIPRDDFSKNYFLAKSFPIAKAFLIVKAFPIEFAVRGQSSGFSD